MNTYSSGGLCLFCWRPHNNNAGSRCKHCGTSYECEPKKANYKKRKPKETESEDFEESQEEQEPEND